MLNIFYVWKKEREKRKLCNKHCAEDRRMGGEMSENNELKEAISLLKQNGIYDQYKSNFKERYKAGIEIKKPRDILFYGFDWSKAREGDDFWRDE